MYSTRGVVYIYLLLCTISPSEIHKVCLMDFGQVDEWRYQFRFQCLQYKTNSCFVIKRTKEYQISRYSLTKICSLKHLLLLFAFLASQLNSELGFPCYGDFYILFSHGRQDFVDRRRTTARPQSDYISAYWGHGNLYVETHFDSDASTLISSQT